jgi:CheY-like chemotaxis protein
MLAAAELGAGLTEQMLVYTGSAPRARKPVELSTLVADMLDLARASLPAAVTLEDRLGAGVWVQGDETQLRQVVLNLIANAGEASGERPGRVIVRTQLADATPEEIARAHGSSELAAGPVALLEVADDGAGMDETTRDRVFEPFFTTKLSGRGLGLAAVLGIVRGHRGRVGVESAPGQGSRFRVYLPRALQPERAAAPPARRVGGARGRTRVLVIDDQEPVLELAREFLGRAGYEVVTAAGGREGLERFSAAPGAFAAVLLDLAMPDLDGAQVGQAMRALRADLPLLWVSGYDADLAAVRRASLDPARVLRKPYEREELVGALEQLLAAAGSRGASALE